ncbi:MULTISPECIES: methylenetetrahydrofolate reductase [unclassified Mesorhizobium]|uniref:methylenetetrahydrofolate reductase n=1 Tax=unclassified Mesorhizobium TaxID=325217 RepID=UPI00112C3670|nr:MULTISPECIES: methylenetetrahydrofolate reductase [unclassified Mesorhizobium]MBZ9701310.1 methylenetetrahydrofolate reductase [Mesorhizobium sp. CO1-1-3]MBZ9948216.1 methylenetetrahydrofolate reductase [Mesorhizobium sp. BR1-1-11]MBZ9957991.1 methylenetetrahydrofolate reductase [Mesorhizobium sp. BR1-1-14]TPJ03171.1 methylenetetrahydrofolate reductase [Mesorhizobium sp. B2-8-1]
MIARQRDENPAGIHLPLDPLPGHTSRGRLERVLRRGEFAVTTELNPPDSADPEDVYNRAKIFDGWVDAINAVDASGANCHMSSVGICALLTRMGYAPIMQIACRDKNRIAIQGDVLGGAAMGVANMLCLTGDGVQAGDQPGAKPVFDLDSMSLLETIRIMRDNGKFLSGRKLTTPPQLFLGAAVNPFAPPFDFRPIHLGKKIAAGAQFVQTQYCFDVPMFKAFMQKARDLGHTEKVFVLCGVGPLASAKTAKWIRSNVPGIHIPDIVIKRLEGAHDQKKEGKQLCIDIINEVKEIPGVSGVHVMAYRQEEYVAEIVDESGVLKGRQPWKREIRRDDQMVADRLDHILHDDVTETQVDMVKTAH